MGRSCPGVGLSSWGVIRVGIVLVGVVLEPNYLSHDQLGTFFVNGE